MTALGLEDLRAITFDFGNTLVRVDRASLRRVVEATGRAIVDRLGPFDLDRFLAIWAEERERQFREEVPAFREVDLADRIVRILARLRGMPPPADDERWDQPAAAARSDPTEVAWAVEAYSDAFAVGMPPDPAIATALARLARDVDLAILSNWPHARTIDRYVAAAGWQPHLRAVVVSQRVGAIKPHPAIFAAARTALGDPPPATILHVGDDWAADVVGAARQGWRTAYLHDRPADSPLPASERTDDVVPDVEIAMMPELPARLNRAGTVPAR